MDPDQTALFLHCLMERLLKHYSIRQKQTTFVVIGVLRVNILIVICAHISTNFKKIELNNEGVSRRQK